VSIADVAARGFGSAGDAYERGRPSYPAEAVSFLAGEMALGPEATVAEVAAGTGKFTRLLVPGGARIVAVEPVAAMHAVLADKVPSAGVVAGAAEALPLAEASVDTVVVAQAFHWFRVPEALAEVARVLRPGGGLGVVWNDRDDTVAWVAELSALIRWDDRPAPSYHEVDWAAAVAATDRFGPVETRRLRLEQRLDAETLVDRVLSTSYIAASPMEDQDALAGRVRGLVAAMEEPFVLPYRTDVFWCHRI
jgi:SAM-dependent methyltransferase